MTLGSRWLAPLVAAAAALLVSSALLLALGAMPGRAFVALVQGAFGDRLALESTLLQMGPLVLIGLGVALSFRCGIWNIGGEGQFAMGALLATAVATGPLSGWPAIVLLPCVLGAGAFGGAFWAGIAGWLKIKRGVSEVLATLMLNFIALQAVAWAVRGPLQELIAAYPQSEAFGQTARLPLLPGLGRVHAGLLLSLLLPPVLFVYLFRAAGGLRMRAVGLAPLAARFAGISPERETLRVLWLSGMLAGFAGALEVSGVTGRLFQNLSPGYGFTAIAVALLGRLHPLAVLPSALFFAALASGSGAMQRAAEVPSVAVKVIEALVILFCVGFAIVRRD